MSRPPLGLSVLVRDATGAQARWASDSRNPEDRPRGITFRTQRMQGFADGGVSLARQIDRDWVDVHLLGDVEFVGDDGSTAYEGRVAAIPRTLDASHSLGLQLQGWMAHARDRKMSEVYVDRDLGRFGPPSNSRLVEAGTGWVMTGDSRATPDEAGTPALVQQMTRLVNHAAGAKSVVEAWYDIGKGNVIGGVYYDLTSYDLGAGGTTVSSPWTIERILSDGDTLSSAEGAGALGGATTEYYTPTGLARRFIALRLWWNSGTNTVEGDWRAIWRNLAVYGGHGLARHGDEPGGLYVSDMLRHFLAKYCPRLSLDGIKSTTYPVPHVVFRDRIDPYDAILELNKYHLWDCSVWEGKTVHYGATDLTDYDWEVRLSDPGVTVSLQGDDVGSLANGIVVQFPNIETGRTDVITPDDYSDLRDYGVENPYNQHGIKGWTEYTLSIPATLDQALQIGRAALAEHNQPKAPGTINARGHIRDRQGHWQPVWKVRANDRVAITSSTSLSDRPRVIHETTYTHDGHGLTVAVDSTLKGLDAEIDRIATALTAAGLT